MTNDSNGKKPGFQFNILKNDPLDGHKGQNIGSISLENVAPVARLFGQRLRRGPLYEPTLARRGSKKCCVVTMCGPQRKQK